MNQTLSPSSLRTKKSLASPQAPEIRISGAKASLKDYASLRSQVRAAISTGKARAQDAVERERVRTSWEIGKLIHEHILLNRNRADYGKQVVKRLSADLSISATELHYMMEFARTNPIFRSTGKLPWGHYQALLRINDPERRKLIVVQASRENWTQKRLRREIGKLKSTSPKAVSAPIIEAPLVPTKGKFDTYRIVIAKAGPWLGKRAIDLGFSNYYLLTKYKTKFKEGDIVVVKTTNSAFSLHASPFTFHDLFTYRAYVLDVTDGDTLWVLVDLGFGFVTQQHLRLRGLDAPEITTRAGLEAKRFVERELKNVSPLIITSTKSDKYDRYLADVFYAVKRKEKFLNNELLKHGLAARVA